jgi:hypothetical protein
MSHSLEPDNIPTVPVIGPGLAARLREVSRRYRTAQEQSAKARGAKRATLVIEQGAALDEMQALSEAVVKAAVAGGCSFGQALQAIHDAIHNPTPTHPEGGHC